MKNYRICRIERNDWSMRGGVCQWWSKPPSHCRTTSWVTTRTGLRNRQTLGDNNISANFQAKELQILKSEISFVGHCLTHEGFTPIHHNLEVVHTFWLSACIKDLLAQYARFAKVMWRWEPWELSDKHNNQFLWLK